MPRYDFRCRQCADGVDDVILSINHDKTDRPYCYACEQFMEQHFTVPPTIHWKDPQIEPFRAVGIPGQPVVTSTRQNRELMARHDLVDANDIKPPTHKDDIDNQRAVEESIKAITPDAKVSDKMAQQGLLDPST
jgi:hypothetical protein